MSDYMASNFRDCQHCDGLGYVHHTRDTPPTETPVEIVLAPHGWFAIWRDGKKLGAQDVGEGSYYLIPNPNAQT